MILKIISPNHWTFEQFVKNEETAKHKLKELSSNLSVADAKIQLLDNDVDLWHNDAAVRNLPTKDDLN